MGPHHGQEAGFDAQKGKMRDDDEGMVGHCCCLQFFLVFRASYSHEPNTLSGRVLISLRSCKSLHDDFAPFVWPDISENGSQPPSRRLECCFLVMGICIAILSGYHWPLYL